MIAAAAVLFLEALLLAFAGVLLGIFLDGLASEIGQRTRLSRRWSLVLVLVSLIGALTALLIYAAPNIARETDQLVHQVPRMLDDATQWLQQYGWGQWLLARGDTATDWLTEPRTVGRASALLSGGLGMIGSLFVILMVGLYVAIEPSLYVRGLLRLVPAERRDRASVIAVDVGQALRKWILVKVIAMLAIFVMTWIGLAIIGIPLSLTLAVLAGLLTFIPNFGPVLSALPAVLLAVPEGWPSLVAVISLYAAAQLIESTTLTPLLERKTLRMPPALTLIAQVAMGLVAGPVGVVIAAPLTAAGLAIGRGVTCGLEARIADRAGGDAKT